MVLKSWHSLSSIFTQSWKTVHQSGSLKIFCQGGWSKWRFCYASGVKRLFLVIVLCKFYKLKFSRGRGREVWIPPPLDPCMYMYAQLQPLCTSFNVLGFFCCFTSNKVPVATLSTSLSHYTLNLNWSILYLVN